MKPSYEQDHNEFSADAYKIEGYRGIAWQVLGWETQPDEDTDWSGYEIRTGKVVAVMIGDDRYFTFDPDEVKAITHKEYCSDCGQIGCFGDRRE